MSLFKKATKAKSDRRVFGVILATGALCLLAAFVLSVEKVHLLENPSAQLSCSFNLVLNCATVMQTPQASVLGFPNSFIGLMLFPLVIAIAIIGLSGAARHISKKLWLTAQIGTLAGTLFALWLFFQSVYVIQVLCPWCLLVTVSTTIMLMALTRYNITQNNLHVPKAWQRRLEQSVKKDYDIVATVAWLVLLTALVLLKFGDGLFV